MSTSVYPVVGRLKNRSMRLEYKQEGDVLGLTGLAPDAFEFMYPDSHGPKDDTNIFTHVYDNYPLFAWLADVRGDSQPTAGLKERHERTLQFIDWIGNDPGVSYVDPTQNKNPKESMYEHYFEGWRNLVMYTVDELLAFNYDAVAYVQKGYDEQHNHTYAPHPELLTWRECFEGRNDNGCTKGYFEFLAETKAKGWDFIIFAFD